MDTLIFARWVIPVEPHGIVLEDYAVVLDKGRIVDLLPRAAAIATYTANNQHTLSTHVLMPGLVNAHTHSPMVLLRGLADDLPLMTWLTEHIWPAENNYLSEEFMREGTEIAIAEMLRGGTTCFNEHYFYPDITAQTAMTCGMRACVGLWLGDVKNPWAQGVDDCLTKGLTTLAHFSAPELQQTNRHLIHFTFAPHSPYLLNDQQLMTLQQASKEHRLPIHMHVHETQDEINTSLAQYKERPLQRLHRLGLLSQTFQAVHMVETTSEDIALIKATGASVIHAPESNLKLASGFCPVHALNQAGVTVALGTDGAASNNDLDMFSEMRTAALIAKAVAKDPIAVSAALALRMATLNGAKALGLDKQIGSIEVGKAADLVAVDFSDINTQPVYHPASQLVYAANSQQVSDVWVAGVQLLKNKKLVHQDKDTLLEKTQKWQARIRAFC